MKKITTREVILFGALFFTFSVYSCKSNSEELKSIQTANVISRPVPPVPTPVNEFTNSNWELNNALKPRIKFTSIDTFSVSAGNNNYQGKYKITSQSGFLKLIEFKFLRSTYVRRTKEEMVFINKLRQAKSFLHFVKEGRLEIYQGNGISTIPMIFKRIKQ